MSYIKDIASKKGITIEELSQKVGFDIVEFEKNPMIVRDLIKIADTLNVQVVDLLRVRIDGKTTVKDEVG